MNDTLTPATPDDPRPETGAWPGFPFPPPLLGLHWRTADQAGAHWLRTVAAMIATGEMNINTLFAEAPATLTRDALALPRHSTAVITAAGIYALGAHAPTGSPALSAFFAAPPAIHRARLLETADRLDA